MGTTISSTNKIDRHDITEILLKVALNSITPFSFRTHKVKILVISPMIGTENFNNNYNI